MDRSERVTRRRELRKTQKTTNRRELFVADYIHHKYSDIYAEAVKFYDVLDGHYPIKNDLKKTGEYRLWKINVKKASSSLSTQIHQTPIQPQAGTSGSTQAQPPWQIYSDNLELRIPLMGHPSVTPETLETVTATETLETVTATETLETVTATETFETVTATETLETVTATETLETVTATETLETVTATETLETVTATETLETVTATETLETVTATETLETLAVDAIDPSLNQEISLEVMQEIIEELRADPDLSRIFSIVEEQFEFEQLGMDIEIPEYGQNLLENW